MDSIKYRGTRKFGDFYENLKIFQRFWGLLTAIVLYGVGVDITVHRFTSAGAYVLAGATFVFICEIAWIVIVFIELLHTSVNVVEFCWWRIFSLCKGWKIPSIYLTFAICLVIWPHNLLWLSFVASGQLTLLAIIRILLTWNHEDDFKGEMLLPEFDDVLDKAEIMSESLDGGNNTQPLQSSEEKIVDTNDTLMQND